jgi:hypothetical protein
MSAHGARPIAKGDDACVTLSMQIEPVENRFGCFRPWPEISSQIGEPPIVAEQNIAVPDTGPEACLPLNDDIAPSSHLKQTLGFRDQQFAAGAAIRSHRRIPAEAAGCAENQGSHKRHLEIAIDGRGSAMGKIAKPVNLPLP